MAEIFGKYQLHEKIAQGGMAEVFVASKQGDIGGFKRRLAIKRVFPHLVDREEIISMFIDEARIASRLNHPNIVQIYDLGVVDGQFFIAMEYVEGKDLREVCELGVAKQNFITRPMAVHVVAQVAAGLDYAHRRTDEQGRPMNIIHRDVSPQNVLISVDGAVKLCDFGIAKAESRITETQVGEFKGKFSYMSPEQFGSTDLDHRSDIFTLGIVLYETTVAARLFRSSSEYEAMRRITEGDFRPPSAVRSDYPPRLEEIVLKALALEPDERYQTAAAFHEDLEEWLFEQRLRTGARQLAGYLRELMDRPPEDVMVSSKPLEKEPSPVRPRAVEEEEGEDPTVQMAMSEEELARLENAPAAGAEEGEDPTIQISMSQRELESLEERRDLLLRPDDDSTLQDVKPPTMADALRSKKEADAVEIRRISPEEARRRRKDGGRGFASDDENTTNPIHDDTDATSDSLPSSREITGKWAEDRKREKRGEPSSLSRPKLADREPAIPQVQPADGQKSVQVKKDSPSSTSSLIGKLPDLRPGGRSLSGLNQIRQRGEPGAIPTSALPAVAGKKESAKSSEFPLSTALIVVAVGAVVAVVAIGMIASFTGNEEEVPGALEGEPIVAEEGVEISPTGTLVGDRQVSLHLETEPAGARVVVNGIVVDGVTPLDVALVEGRDNEIWIMRRRHRPERLLIPGHDESMERTVQLERTSTTEGASVEFHSDPQGAQVLLNGEVVGEAPFRMANVRTDSPVHIQFEMEGHRPYVAFLDLSANDQERLEATLPARDEEVVVGTYRVAPRGSRVLREGELLATTPFEHRHHRQEWLELEVQGHQRQTQHHRLRLDAIGGFTLAFSLAEEARATGTLSIDVEPRAAIYVDHRAFGAAPIEEVELPAGEQTVVLETLDGKRVRVPIEIDADSHRSYRMEIDGDEAKVELVDP